MIIEFKVYSKEERYIYGQKDYRIIGRYRC